MRERRGADLQEEGGPGGPRKGQWRPGQAKYQKSERKKSVKKRQGIEDFFLNQKNDLGNPFHDPILPDIGPLFAPAKVAVGQGVKWEGRGPRGGEENCCLENQPAGWAPANDIC